jgi:hypothetical protein
MTAPHEFVIWSMEHEAWWAPGSLGYAPTLDGAGIYSREDAAFIVRRANIVKCHEAMIPVEALIGLTMGAADATTLAAALRRLLREVPDCDCRTPKCGHPASAHVGLDGACIVAGCPCGPGGWS